MILVYQSIDLFQFQQVKLLLNASGIAFQERNTVVSAYNNFGTYQLYVSSQDEQHAKELIENAFT
ncbi:MAG: DUF2007 domain-containing protein [Bacteroidetes bacterium]|nr:DUF2007 domain-containing protein [Bacteroidota bacterium]MBM3418224.1 DUF2007 domain-containing protein [Bacteroidota bacterium]